MLAREPYGSWDLARDVHLFRSLERLGIPCVSGLALGRSDGTHPSYAPQRIGGCSSNGCDFPVCFPFPSCHCAFASSNRYRHGMVVRHSGPHLHRYTRHDEWSGHCHVDWDSSVRLRHNANCVHHWILRGVAAGVALRSWRALPRCNQARTDGSSAAATGVRKAAPRLTCPLRVTRVGILTSALCRRSRPDRDCLRSGLGVGRGEPFEAGGRGAFLDRIGYGPRAFRRAVSDWSRNCLSANAQRACAIIAPSTVATAAPRRTAPCSAHVAQAPLGSPNFSQWCGAIATTGMPLAW